METDPFPVGGVPRIYWKHDISFPETQAEALHSLDRYNICFLYAPLYNSVMRHLAPIRRELGIRSCFNIIGPLLNPFGVQTLLVGVYTPKLVRPMAEILKKRGVRRAMVVHSMGMDEATTLGSTQYCEVSQDGRLKEGYIEPQQCGLHVGKLEELRGGSAEVNAKILSDIFQRGHP
jgi:anthranilate phosphoribosyltransferase